MAPVTHGSWVIWVMGQELNMYLSHGSLRVTQFPAVAHTPMFEILKNALVWEHCKLPIGVRGRAHQYFYILSALHIIMPAEK